MLEINDCEYEKPWALCSGLFLSLRFWIVAGYLTLSIFLRASEFGPMVAFVLEVCVDCHVVVPHLS